MNIIDVKKKKSDQCLLSGLSDIFSVTRKTPRMLKIVKIVGCDTKALPIRSVINSPKGIAIIQVTIYKQNASSDVRRSISLFVFCSFKTIPTSQN